MANRPRNPIKNQSKGKMMGTFPQSIHRHRSKQTTTRIREIAHPKRSESFPQRRNAKFTTKHPKGLPEKPKKETENRSKTYPAAEVSRLLCGLEKTTQTKMKVQNLRRSTESMGNPVMELLRMGCPPPLYGSFRGNRWAVGEGKRNADGADDGVEW